MWPTKKSNEDTKLFIARLINEENDFFAVELARLKYYNGISSAQKLIETITFAHKKSIELLEKIYAEL